MSEKGCIELDYPFVMSWLWEKPHNVIIMSMIIVDEKERGKGHTTRLINDLQQKYDRIIVPNPSIQLLNIIGKHDFVYSPSDEISDLWVWRKVPSKIIRDSKEE